MLGGWLALKLCVGSGLLILCAAPGFGQTALTLHYDKPAGTWNEALPIGNGRLGAMVFGGVNQEQIRLNEASLWSGGPVGENVNPRAYEFLAPARAALARGEYGRAGDLVKNMQGRFSQSYLPLGDLMLQQITGAGNVTGYRRDLDLHSGVATTAFTVEGVRYRREVFVSAPDQIMVLRFSADTRGKISLNATMKSQLRARPAPDPAVLTVAGRAPTQVDPSYFSANNEPIVYDPEDVCKGMRFELSVRPRVVGGTLHISDGTLAVRNATEVVLLMSAATSFNGFDQCPFSAGQDEHRLNLAYLEAASQRKYAQLLERHLIDFRRYFDRVSLRLNPGEDDQSDRPTDQRLDSYARGGADSNLEALYFQYGRYLLLSSSRTANVPANLQGIWNQDLRPPWSSNYTININLQMNYWPVESANLSELFAPLDGFIHNLALNGAKTAGEFYHAHGWVAHHNSDIWAHSDPVGDLGKGDPMWANWYMGGNWLSRHLWEHYQFTGDREFLEGAYPVMKGAAEFALDWLQRDPQGHLVTAPSTSPENVYFYDKDVVRRQGAVTVASTMDMGIIRDLFANVIAASTLLDIDPAFRARLAAAQRQLFPFQVGAKGQLQEWFQDFEDVDPHHRHTSHLYALHPANEISPLATPELAAAAKRTLELRGDEGTGWSLAWKVNMWARLLDGNHAYGLFRKLLRLTKDNDTRYDGHGGVYPNLLDAHPPFQIDGNFGATAGVVEMLLQSQNEELHLLPALPDAWAQGSVNGLMGRGGYVVSLAWADHRLKTATILARNPGECVIRTWEPVRIESLGLRSEKAAIGYTLRFKAQRGRRYHVSGIE
jgi:alpha-L-fucosidase 2